MGVPWLDIDASNYGCYAKNPKLQMLCLKSQTDNSYSTGLGIFQGPGAHHHHYLTAQV